MGVCKIAKYFMQRATQMSSLPACMRRTIAQAAAKSAQHRGKLLDGNLF
jgi:hypothetical protein